MQQDPGSFQKYFCTLTLWEFCLSYCPRVTGQLPSRVTLLAPRSKPGMGLWALPFREDDGTGIWHQSSLHTEWLEHVQGKSALLCDSFLPFCCFFCSPSLEQVHPNMQKNQLPGGSFATVQSLQSLGVFVRRAGASWLGSIPWIQEFPGSAVGAVLGWFLLPGVRAVEAAGLAVTPSSTSPNASCSQGVGVPFLTGAMRFRAGSRRECFWLLQLEV